MLSDAYSCTVVFLPAHKREHDGRQDETSWHGHPEVIWTERMCRPMRQSTLQMLRGEPVRQLDAALFPLVKVDRQPQRHLDWEVGLEGAVVSLQYMSLHLQPATLPSETRLMAIMPPGRRHAPFMQISFNSVKYSPPHIGACSRAC